MDDTPVTSIGRLAFWLQLPALVLLTGAIGLLLDVAGDAPGRNMFGGVLLFFAGIVLFVVLVSMTANAVLLLRRPQSLTQRSLPRPIAVRLLILYCVIAVWIVLLVSLDIFLISWLFVAAIIVLSVMVQSRALKWAPHPVAHQTVTGLTTPLRVALVAYCVLAIAASVYAVATIVDPTLDGDGLRRVILLGAFGLPQSLLAVPVALLVTPLLGPVTFALPLAAVAANLVIAQLLLWSPRTRTRLVNWFFRCTEEPARSN